MEPSNRFTPINPINLSTYLTLRFRLRRGASGTALSGLFPANFPIARPLLSP